MLKNCIYGILIFLCESVVAESVTEDHKEMPRFEYFEPTYFVYRGSSDEDRDSAWRGHYSFAYQVCNWGEDIDDERICARKVDEKLRHSFFLTYTGEFDFYLNSRPSGPVINRISNPALHYRYHFNEQGKNYKEMWIKVSLEHLSNGQSEDVSTPRGTERAARAYSEGDYQYFDTVSRGSDFLALETHYKKGIAISLKAKTYLGDPESDITWGELSGQGVSIKDYDRYRFVVHKYFQYKDRKIQLAANWTLGDEFLDTDSFEVDFTFEFLKLPWLLKYHHGPLMTLSNYALEDSYIGFGVNLLN